MVTDDGQAPNMTDVSKEGNSLKTAQTLSRRPSKSVMDLLSIQEKSDVAIKRIIPSLDLRVVTLYILDLHLLQAVSQA